MPDIPINDNLEPVGVSKETKQPELEEIELSEATRRKYQNRVHLTFWDRVQLTWRGKTDVGKALGIGLDIAESFAPKWVAKIRTQIQYRIMSNQAKSTPKSKTVITFGLLFLAGLLQLLGVDLGLELSTDAQWVTTGVGIVGVILRLVTNKPVKLGEALGLSKQ